MAARRQRHRDGMARLKQGGEGRMLGRRTELTAIRSSGEEFPVELAITPSSDASGEIFVGYLRGG